MLCPDAVAQALANRAAVDTNGTILWHQFVDAAARTPHPPTCLRAGRQGFLQYRGRTGVSRCGSAGGWQRYPLVQKLHRC
jgi:hypothetical protein